VAGADVLIIAGSFASAGHTEWAIAIAVTGALSTPLLMRAHAPVAVTPLQLIWLVASGLVAIQFASTGVGPTSGFVVWAFAYVAWLLYRLGQRNVERRAQMTDFASVAPIVPAAWPVVVRYPSGRALAFRFVFAFFALGFLSSLWLLGNELTSNSPPGLGLILTLWHVSVLWVLLSAGSRSADRVALYSDRIEIRRLIGRSQSVLWAEASEAHVIRWAPQGFRTPQLQLLGLSGNILASLDLGDAKQRALLAIVRGRLVVVPWRSVRRTSWL
jgi:hypothetical protein